jgi:tRNA(Arg) A34 adenosine deaminase TadA
MTQASSSFTRRRLLRGATFAVAAAASARPLRAQSAASDAETKRFMALAFAMRDRAVAEGDQPFGAVVVKDGRVVGEGPSRVRTNRDPTAHAEVEAIRDAARRLGTADLSGCVLYASSRPCPMCATAAYWAQIARVYHGAEATDAGPPRYPGC